MAHHHGVDGKNHQQSQETENHAKVLDRNLIETGPGTSDGARSVRSASGELAPDTSLTTALLVRNSKSRADQPDSCQTVFDATTGTEASEPCLKIGTDKPRSAFKNLRGQGTSYRKRTSPKRVERKSHGAARAMLTLRWSRNGRRYREEGAGPEVMNFRRRRRAGGEDRPRRAVDISEKTRRR